MLFKLPIKIGRLAAQCMLAAAVISVVPLVLLSLVFSSHVSDALMAKSQEEFDLALYELEHIVQSKVSDRQLDLLTMANDQAIAGVHRAKQHSGLDPVDGQTLEQLRTRLTVLFSNYTKIHTGTLQVRYLDAEGHEWLRVERHGESVRIVDAALLQDKSERPYYQQALRAGPGQCVVSPINLNQERGILDRQTPVVYYSTPLWHGGRLQGVLVMNVDADELLEEMALTTSAGRVLLAGPDGVYMYHETEAKRWGNQLNTDESLFNDWPQMRAWANPSSLRARADQTLHLTSEDGERLLSVSSIVFDPFNTPWIMGIELDRLDAVAAAHAMRRYVLWSALAIGAVAVLLALMVAKIWTRPLLALAQAADAVRRGDYTTRVDVQRQDELGELAQSFNAMAQELERVVDIEQQHAKAEAANQAKSAFLANMSHEIRTPMSAILGFTELLHDPALDAASRAGHIDTIQRNGEHLMRLLDDILDLSKIEAGKMVTERVATAPKELVEEVGSLMSARAQSKGIQLALAYGQGLPAAVLTDPVRVRQILINLVGNAIKFTETGSVRIHAYASDADTPGHARLHVDVIDTGIGISGEAIDALFKPFSQADTSTTRRFGGTGLGLTICKRFAQMLDGDITVSSVPNQGSTFSLTICAERTTLGPAQPAAGQSPRQDADAPDTPDTPDTPLTGRVLLAEDGPDNQRLILFHLKKMGLQPTLAADGRAAVETLLEHRDRGEPFDLVLMDMQMPVMDGYDATRRLRELGYSGPIIALTAHAMAGDRQRCLDAGCDEYATKPIDRDKLRALLAAVLQRRCAA